MSVKKRCGCKQPCRNEGHHWHIRLNLRRNGATRETGPVTKYAFLLDDRQPLPTTRAEALDLEARVRTWVLSGRKAIVVPGGSTPEPVEAADSTTIAAAAQAYLTNYIEKELDGVSEAGIVRRIAHELGTRPLAALTDRKIVRTYLQGVQASCRRRGRHGHGAVNHHRARWSHFMNWCRAEYGLTGESPFYQRTLRPQGLKRHLEESRDRRLREGEDEALLAACQTLDDGGMMLGRYYCALDTLLRRNEMLQLKSSQLRKDQVKGRAVYYLTVKPSTAKSRKKRELAVRSPRLVTFLDARRFSPYVFGQKDGSPISVTQFRTDWKHVLIAAGLLKGEYRKPESTAARSRHHWIVTKNAGLTWRDLRREGASRLHDNGVPLRRIQQLLGHSSLAMTERYLALKDDDMVDSLDHVAKVFGL